MNDGRAAFWAGAAFDAGKRDGYLTFFETPFKGGGEKLAHSHGKFSYGNEEIELRANPSFRPRVESSPMAMIC